MPQGACPASIRQLADGRRPREIQIIGTTAAAALLARIYLNAAAQAPIVETVAEYPTGTFLENLDVLPDGRIVFTSYFAKTIEVLAAKAKPRTFATLSAHPVGILAVGDGFLV